MKYKLPPIDEEAFALALSAYRSALEHEARIDLKWEPRVEEVRKADEFSGLRRRFENQTYHAEKLREFAKDIFNAAATRGRPFPEYVYGGDLKDFFDRYGGAGSKKVVAEVRAAYEAVDRTKIRRSL